MEITVNVEKLKKLSEALRDPQLECTIADLRDGRPFSWDYTDCYACAMEVARVMGLAPDDTALVGHPSHSADIAAWAEYHFGIGERPARVIFHETDMHHPVFLENEVALEKGEDVPSMTEEDVRPDHVADMIDLYLQEIDRG